MKYILLIIVVFVSFVSFGFSDDVLIFSEYMRTMNVVSGKNSKLPKISLLNKIFLVKDQKCEYTME